MVLRYSRVVIFEKDLISIFNVARSHHPSDYELSTSKLSMSSRTYPTEVCTRQNSNKKILSCLTRNFISNIESFLKPYLPFSSLIIIRDSFNCELSLKYSQDWVLKSFLTTFLILFITSYFISSSHYVKFHLRSIWFVSFTLYSTVTIRKSAILVSLILVNSGFHCSDTGSKRLKTSLCTVM